ncbi:hypothetical protein KFL_001690090 [Klebsormidium nitens]|uniref:Uncharacterized protein n=1 Tax=Klebsormidium nitens TaxID=105231 RepID=A0A1Y1I432_KLENI|nr:hypothetical protein KFL_001690090 [Klebsormidium nitens]|eukprot:GAQ83931.1 hypothetical protein KFL_001690090 [Klebsormidium nitens]
MAGGQEGVVVVVGAGPGISQAVARKFGRENFKVALLGRREASLAELCDKLKELGITAKGYVADAGDFAALKQAMEQLTEELGSPTVLVYNAAGGMTTMALPKDLDPETLVQDFRVSSAGALAAVQQVLPAFRKAGGGTILLTGGILAIEPLWPIMCSLSAGKAAVRNLGFALYKDLLEENIHVATVTVCGRVEPGSGELDPDHIADIYWELHTEKKEQWRREVYVPKDAGGHIKV